MPREASLILAACSLPRLRRSPAAELAPHRFDGTVTFRHLKWLFAINSSSFRDGRK